MAEAGLGQFLGGDRAARGGVALEDLDLPAGTGQVRGRDQAVVTASHDDGVDAPTHRPKVYIGRMLSV